MLTGKADAQPFRFGFVCTRASSGGLTPSSPDWPPRFGTGLEGPFSSFGCAERSVIIDMGSSYTSLRS